MTPPDQFSGLETRRSSPRKPFAAFLDVRLLTGASYRGVARDLSAEGMGAVVFTDTKVASILAGTPVEIAYEHPVITGNELVTRRASVIGRYGNRYGFHFEQSRDVPNQS